MLDIPIRIQAVPWDQRRVKNAIHLAESTGGKIVWDDSRNPYTGFLNVLREFGDGAGILIEDDVVLCDDWTDRVGQAVAAYQNVVINFFWYDEQPPYVPQLLAGKEFSGMLCVYFPPGIAAGFVKWQEDKQASDFRNNYHDWYFARYLNHLRVDFCRYLPTLVQHKAWPSSVLPNRVIRQSSTFGRRSS